MRTHLQRLEGIQQVGGELLAGSAVLVGGDDELLFGVAADVQRLLELCGAVAVADVCHQLAGGTDQGAGVRILATAMMDEEGSGAVNGLEQGVLIADVGGRSAA